MKLFLLRLAFALGFCLIMIGPILLVRQNHELYAPYIVLAIFVVPVAAVIVGKLFEPLKGLK